MSRDSVIALIIRVVCGISAFEVITNAVFEWVGKHHNTPAWVATMVAGGIGIAMRAYWNEKKEK